MKKLLNDKSADRAGFIVNASWRFTVFTPRQSLPRNGRAIDTEKPSRQGRDHGFAIRSHLGSDPTHESEPASILFFASQREHPFLHHSYCFHRIVCIRAGKGTHQHTLSSGQFFFLGPRLLTLPQREKTNSDAFKRSFFPILPPFPAYFPLLPGVMLVHVTGFVLAFMWYPPSSVFRRPAP